MCGLGNNANEVKEGLVINMAGTKSGGLSAAKTNKAKYGKDFYKRIGAKGGRIGRTGGFASLKVGTDGLDGRERARLVGAKGGKISRKNKYGS